MLGVVGEVQTCEYLLSILAYFLVFGRTDDNTGRLLCRLWQCGRFSFTTGSRRHVIPIGILEDNFIQLDLKERLAAQSHTRTIYIFVFSLNWPYEAFTIVDDRP